MVPSAINYCPLDQLKLQNYPSLLNPQWKSISSLSSNPPQPLHFFLKPYMQRAVGDLGFAEENLGFNNNTGGETKLRVLDRERELVRMKIQCNACEIAEASVMCCADEAALCRACDEKIHSANKLASKHPRVPLSNSPSQMPNCDICQETTGYFFCLEDRALLCRECDFAIHTANAYVSVHQRFLLTGVKVGLEPKESVVVPSVEKRMNSMKNDREITSKSLSKRGNSMSLPCDTKDVISSQAVGDGGLPVGKASFSGGSTPGIIPDWRLDDFLGLTGFNQNYGFMEQGSSKVDGVKFGDSEWSPIYQSAIEDGDVDEYLGQVPEVLWTVPKIPSPPTASGLYWPKKIQNNLSADDSVSVPDICCLESDRGYHLHTGNPKRQRNF